MHVTIVCARDDLTHLVTAINAAQWDDANAIPRYEETALRAYLERQDTVFLACHDIVDGRPVLLGIASARLEVKPYGARRWLYVDEVDVCVDQRQRGAGTCLMRELLAIARAAGCEEVWLGTESDNVAANALYRSLEPDDVASVIGYTYETDE